MQIAKDSVVSFNYKMYENDVLLEDSGESDPVLYMHGRKAIFPAMETALEGKQANDKLEVTLSPEQAYGVRTDTPLQRVPVKHLMPRRTPRVGDIFQVNTENGPRQVVVKKVGKFNVDVDTNHPLAGKTLRFEIEISEVREATEEEIEHGHAHGAGGHQH